jgi:PTS system cellobiose-specific IIA component
MDVNHCRINPYIKELLLDTSELAVKIIAYAGDSHSYSMEAIEAARSGDFTKADELLKKSDDSLTEAHQYHTKLLVYEARAGNNSVGMILVHASNHFSVAQVVRDLAEQFVDLYKEIRNCK